MLVLLPIVFIGLYIATFMMGRYSKNQLQTFLDRNKAITDETALNEYKAMVRVNMHLALALMGIGLIGICMTAIAVSRIGFTGFFLFSGLGLAVGLNIKGAELEKQSRALKCANPDLEKRYQEVTRVWQKHLFPNF